MTSVGPCNTNTKQEEEGFVRGASTRGRREGSQSSSWEAWGGLMKEVLKC